MKAGHNNKYDITKTSDLVIHVCSALVKIFIIRRDVKVNINEFLLKILFSITIRKADGFTY